VHLSNWRLDHAVVRVDGRCFLGLFLAFIGVFWVETCLGNLPPAEKGPGIPGETGSVKTSITRKVSSISQYGITWTFDKEYTVGQFVTGDYWVVGPVRVVSISPAPADGRNGSMVNPMPGEMQAYDSRNSGYRASLGKCPPFDLSPGDSLVSTVSLASYPYRDLMGRSLSSGHAFTKEACILTCVDAPPDESAFRPPYVGTDKKIYLATSLQRDRLPRLPVPSNAPDLEICERYFQRPWIDHMAGWSSRRMHPADNMPNYGRELATVVGDAALQLCLDRPQSEKERLLIGLVQVGIDNYHSALLNKHLWSADGGHMIGRKFPILFAGLMLNEKGMLTLDDYESQEDATTYFGGAGDVLWTGWQNSGHPYAAHVLYRLRDGQDMVGKPWSHENYHPRDWGNAPFPNNPSSPQYPYEKHDPYRRLASAAIPGQTIAARILGLKSYWNHEAYFCYVDRWMYEDDAPNYRTIKKCWPTFAHVRPGGSCESEFARKMYLTYRSQY